MTGVSNSHWTLDTQLFHAVYSPTLGFPKAIACKPQDSKGNREPVSLLPGITHSTITILCPRKGLKQGIGQHHWPETSSVSHLEGLCSNSSFPTQLHGFYISTGGFYLVTPRRMQCDLSLLPALPSTCASCLDAASRQEDVLCVCILSEKEIYVLFAVMTVRKLWWHKCLQKDE